jgi:hypothetical protein
MMRDASRNGIGAGLLASRLVELNKHGDNGHSFGWSPLLFRQARCA